VEIISRIDVLREALKNLPGIAFVPTMGNLHEGHLDLVSAAKKQGKCVVVSIFVNPLQFGVGEDLEKYPRTLEQDCRLLRHAGADIVFTPCVDALFPTAQQFHVEPPAIANELCGAARPGHFRGVATIVLKLLNIVRPEIALFGKKDYQQLHIIRAMTAALDVPVAILPVETRRADDGLALSSRNGYLSPAERAEAPRLYQNLLMIRQRLSEGEKDLQKLESGAALDLSSHGWKVDYISLRHPDTLQPATPEDQRMVALGAARLGSTRLIDNLEICI
jgi:pantoate--beta-alanine ligase